jgi:transposase
MATWVIDGSGAGGTEPRRRFSDDDKARIVSEAMMPGASVLDVARRHRVCTSLVYRWRRSLLRDGVVVEAPLLPAPASTFVPVEVASAPASTQPEPLGPGVVEVVAPSGQRIRLAPPIDARVLKAVLAGFG